MRVLVLSLLAIITGFWMSAAAEEAEIKAPAPDWVVEQPISNMPDDRANSIRDGIGFLLTDTQKKWDGDGYDYYDRMVYEITERTGLEAAARITPSFDPEDTTLAFSRLDIIRDGKRIDRLADTEIELIQQESELNEGILDGTLTAIVQLEDVRVGDIIDYAYHGEVSTPLWPGEFFTSEAVEWSVPVATQSFRLLAPAEAPLTITRVGTDTPVETSRVGADLVYSFRIQDAEPVLLETNIAYGHVLFGYIAFSSMDEWTDVVDWAMGLYDVDYDLPADFETRIDALARQYPDKEDRIVQAMRIVQSENRYLGLQAGLGSHKPRTPEVTLTRGYGDCKDKSLLLSVILQKLGIDARPALASTYDGFALAGGPVIVGAFNHAIVHVKLDGKSIWLDPTLSHQGGTLSRLSIPDYGYALPIRAETTDLELIERSFPKQPEEEIEEVITFLGGEDTYDHAQLDVRTIYRGRNADGVRNRLANNGIDHTGRQYLDYYSEYYPGITATRPIEVSDDLDHNEITITEAYAISEEAYEAAELSKSMPLRATAVLGEIPASIEANRTAEMWLPYGTYTAHTVKVHVPGKTLAVPEGVTLEAHGVSVKQAYQARSEWLIVNYELKVTERSVAAGHAMDIIELKNDLDDIGYLEVYINRASPTFARRLGLSEALPAETETALMEVSLLLGKKKHVEALEMLAALLETNPDPTPVRGYIQLLRGAIFDERKRSSAALAAYREAFELTTPDWTSSYFSYAGMVREDSPVEAAAIMERLFTEHPSAIGGVNMKWLRGLLRELDESGARDEQDRLVTAAGKAQYANRKEGDVERWLYAAMIEPLVRAGEVDTARTVVTEITDPEMLAHILMKRDTEPVWSDIEAKYGADLTVALNQFVEQSEKEALEDTSDFKVQSRYVNALRQAGLYDRAIVFGEELIGNWARIEAVGDEAYWFVNEYAYALEDAGRTDEAIALMDRVLDLGIEENPQLISMAINRAHMFLSAGRFEDALDASKALEQLDDHFASDYGEMYIYSAKVCAMHELGRTSEATSALNEQLMPLADTNPSAHMLTLLCLGDEDAAAELMVNRLDDDSSRDAALYGFVYATKDGEMPAYQKKLHKRIATVQQRKEVEDAFLTHARHIRVTASKTYWGRF